jgi:hypothetical protein
MDGWMDRWMDGWMGGWIEVASRRAHTLTLTLTQLRHQTSGGARTSGSSTANAAGSTRKSNETRAAPDELGT